MLISCRKGRSGVNTRRNGRGSSKPTSIQHTIVELELAHNSKQQSQMAIQKETRQKMTDTPAKRNQHTSSTFHQRTINTFSAGTEGKGKSCKIANRIEEKRKAPLCDLGRKGKKYLYSARSKKDNRHAHTLKRKNLPFLR